MTSAGVVRVEADELDSWTFVSAAGELPDRAAVALAPPVVDTLDEDALRVEAEPRSVVSALVAEAELPGGLDEVAERVFTFMVAEREPRLLENPGAKALDVGDLVERKRPAQERPPGPKL